MKRGDAGALAAELGAVLAARGAACVTAESCTGGLVAAAITAVAGSSGWFERGFVTYSNDAKVDLLGVPAATIAAHGAVSEPVAQAMAEGALVRTPATFAVAVTGIAGPGGGSPDKPVGTVCFAWAAKGAPAQSAVRRFDGDRHAVREAATVEALAGLVALARR